MFWTILRATSRKNYCETLKPLSANLTKWSHTLKQFVSNLPTNCLSVFDHFVGLALKRLIQEICEILDDS